MRANSRTALETETNNKITLFSQICQNLHLNMSIEKTKFMMLGSNKLDLHPPIFKLNTHKIEKVKELKVLGLVLDEKLRWDKHINSIKSKILQLTSSITRVFSATWGVSRVYLRTWYVTVLEKVLDYGSEVWFDDLRVIDKRSLQSIQRQCLLSITKTYKNVATTTLQTLLGIPPILLTLEYKSFKHQLLENKNFMTYKQIPILKIDVEDKTEKYKINPELHLSNLIKTVKS